MKFKTNWLVASLLLLVLTLPFGLITLMLMIGKGSIYDEYFAGLPETSQIFIFLLFAGVTLLSASYSAYIVVPERKKEGNS